MHSRNVFIAGCIYVCEYKRWLRGHAVDEWLCRCASIVGLMKSVLQDEKTQRYLRWYGRSITRCTRHSLSRAPCVYSLSSSSSSSVLHTESLSLFSREYTFSTLAERAENSGCLRRSPRREASSRVLKSRGSAASDFYANFRSCVTKNPSTSINFSTFHHMDEKLLHCWIDHSRFNAK